MNSCGRLQGKLYSYFAHAEARVLVLLVDNDESFFEITLDTEQHVRLTLHFICRPPELTEKQWLSLSNLGNLHYQNTAR